MGIPDQLAAGLAVYKGNAWQRETVSFFRPSLSPDGAGGSTVTVPVTATGTVAADPIIQQGIQTMLIDGDDTSLRVGDLVQIQHSQFRT